MQSIPPNALKPNRLTWFSCGLRFNELHCTRMIVTLYSVTRQGVALFSNYTVSVVHSSWDDRVFASREKKISMRFSLLKEGVYCMQRREIL